MSYSDFRRVRKITESDLRLSVRPSARNNSAPTGRIFMKFDMSVFRKFVVKIQVSLKSDKNNRYFYMTTNIHFLSHLAKFFL